MDDLKKLLIKEYTSIINGKTISYKQLTYYEVIEFIIEISNSKQDNDALHYWIIKFIKESNPHILDEDFVYVNIEDLWQKLKETAFIDYFKEEKVKSSKSSRTLPFGSWLLSMSKQFQKDPLYVLQHYTPECFNYLVDCYIYLENEKTKEGRKENDLSNLTKQTKELGKGETPQEAAARIRKLKEEFEKAKAEKGSYVTKIK